MGLVMDQRLALLILIGLHGLGYIATSAVYVWFYIADNDKSANNNAANDFR